MSQAYTPIETPLRDTLQRLLAGLKSTTEGVILHSLAERALDRYTRRDGQVGIAFIVFLYKLLDSYLANRDNDPGTRIKAKVLRQRLAGYLPEAVTAASPVPKHPAAAREKPQPAPMRHTPSVTGKVTRRPETLSNLEAPSTAPIDDDVDNMPLRLARNVSEAIARTREFDVLLKSNLTSLQKTQDSDDLEDLKQALIRDIESLIEGHQALGNNLQSSTTYLRVIHSDRLRLRDTLHKVRKHSLSDELTGLPNRAAFLRQLDGEIGRAKRYGFSLAVAILDVDDLKTINQQYGKDAGDRVLNFYGREIMSQFRGYDLIARYGGDEFAVLFPNTQKEGAARALEKAHKLVTETYLDHQGKTLSLPTFTSSLTLYAHGEKPETLLTRASKALDHAKLRGWNQSVVALPAG